MVDGINRPLMLKALERRFAKAGKAWSPSTLRFYWKRYAWVFAIGMGRVFKRTLDVSASVIALLMLSPLFLILAFLIKRHDGGPVLFWQVRVGQWGREFPFPKFRSMVTNAEAVKKELLSQNQHSEGVTFKMRNDPRITPVGRFIRKTSIDELPQLWCVLVGDMSLVGPRPPLPQEVQQYNLIQRRRLDVKPGLTCFWQVEGRGDIPFSQQVELDVQYIHSQSWWLDIWLLLKTVPAVILGKGAY
jgi:lipopolysaccharide/colanic/teichoic acid biosynthesis glycosyltransferase